MTIKELIPALKSRSLIIIAALREHIAKIIAVLWFLALSLLLLFDAVALWGTFPQKIQDILSNSQTVLSMEVLQWLLNLIGISSFAVEVVNERSTQRCQGILLGDVLRHYFPFYRATYLFHLCFFLFGNIACFRDPAEETAAVASLVGLVSCTVYSIAVTCLLAVPQSGKNHFVHGYLSAALKRSAETAQSQPNRKGAEHQRIAAACVQDYASYVSGLWARASYRPSSKPKRSEEWQLIWAAFAWLKQIPLKKAEPLQKPLDSQACRAAFCSIFSSPEGRAPGEWVLFTGCLPGHSSERIASSTQFRQEALRCSAVWDNLLTQLDGSRRKSQMAFHILSCAKQFSPECFAIFAGGLILQSQALYFKSERDGTEKLWAAINFLRGLYREEEERSLMQDASIASISAEWLELMLITAAGLLWNCAFQFHSPRQVREYCRFIRQAVYNCNSSAVRQELAANYPVYITYAFVLTWAANVEVCQKLSICQQTLFYDYVRREMADMLAG